LQKTQKERTLKPGIARLTRDLGPPRPAPPAVMAEARRHPTELIVNDVSLDQRLQEIVNHPSYRLAFLDPEFIRRDDLRPLRFELELLKPEITLIERGIRSTVVVFGGTQILEEGAARERLRQAQAESADHPQDSARRRAVRRAEQIVAKSHYYTECRQFARIVSEHNKKYGDGELIVVTGGGPGIMEAANRGAYDVNSPSMGLNITLPFEQVPNPYITPGLCFQFNYFAIRKMHFLLRAKALVCFPGGYGTLDELFTTLTLRQTERMQQIPIILYGTKYWRRVIDLEFLADEGVIRDEHLELFQFADSPQQAWKIIADYHQFPIH
jgi:uncharacterized protein (TIGR00730 family)